MQKSADLELKNLSQEIADRFQNILTWQWDDRFNMVLAEFDVEHIPSVFKDFKIYFKDIWDFNSINTAPKYIRLHCECFGRFHSDQIFCVTDSHKDSYVYCVIWPWSNGDMVSIRLAPHNRLISDQETEQLAYQFKHWFQL